MEPAHIHLLLNHFPIFGSLFGFVLLAYGLIAKSDSVIESALFSFIVIAVVSIPTFLSGELAEKVVERMNIQNKVFIEAHEEVAIYGLWLMMLLGICSLIALIQTIRKRKNVRKLQYGILLFSLITFLVMSYVGTTGGNIRHTEIRKSDGLNQLNQIPW